jgi:outer membrane protein OmpA-like peptidoglycan-associated protein
MKNTLKILIYFTILSGLVFLYSCSAQKKLERIKKGETPSAQLSLGRQESFIPEIKNEKVSRDTLKIKDEDGTEILIMKAVKDEETGEMVAADVLDAAMVTARFRNIAERKGKVDLAFQVIVPASMRDSRWQLRFYPDMFVLEDSVRLEPVIITGSGYRKAQLKGYEQYEKFLSRIIEDSTAFVNVRQLEIFLKRNIPEVYAFKADSTYVSDEQFLSAYGVSQREAVEHYTNKFAKSMNERRKSRKDKMYARYVKAPIVTEGIRLDTVMISSEGDFIYNYVQTINTRPKLRRADIVLSGDIYEQDQKLYDIPRSEPLTFYISSIAAFVDNTERYMTKVVERRASANTECRIDFEVGKYDVKPELGENAVGIKRIEATLASLLENDTFDLDSVVISATASPEGSYASNGKLAQKRSESVSRYFQSYMRHYADSLVEAAGVSMDMDGNVMTQTRKVDVIPLTPRCIPENWEGLHSLVEQDVVMNVDQKDDFFKRFGTKDPDAREAKMRSEDYYKYMRSALYPQLRTVKFNFYLHRKGMIKDTVHTTVIDSTYMRGVQALRDMDYDAALALLRPYEDFNTAVAYMGMDRNKSAMKIISKMERTPEINYLLAILYSREGELDNAVECYVRSCKQNPSYVYRGNLDPEISVLIKMYGLNQEEDEYIDEY